MTFYTSITSTLRQQFGDVWSAATLYIPFSSNICTPGDRMHPVTASLSLSPARFWNIWEHIMRLFFLFILSFPSASLSLSLFWKEGWNALRRARRRVRRFPNHIKRCGARTTFRAARQLYTLTIKLPLVCIHLNPTFKRHTIHSVYAFHVHCDKLNIFHIKLVLNCVDLH